MRYVKRVVEELDKTKTKSSIESLVLAYAKEHFSKIPISMYVTHPTEDDSVFTIKIDSGVELYQFRLSKNTVVGLDKLSDSEISNMIGNRVHSGQQVFKMIIVIEKILSKYILDNNGSVEDTLASKKSDKTSTKSNKSNKNQVSMDIDSEDRDKQSKFNNELRVLDIDRANHTIDDREYQSEYNRLVKKYKVK